MSDQPAPVAAREASSRGFALAIVAYLLWGFLPLYMKAVGHIPAVEVVAHRALWSLPIAALALLWIGRSSDLLLALRTPRMLGMAVVTAAIISVNWGIYVWAIAAGRTVEAALGYYINPLFSVFLAAMFLGERLTRAQIVAIALAVIAVSILAWERGGLPWVSVALAVSWGFYAMFKRALPIGPNQGFFLEVLLISVPAMAYLIWLGLSGQSHFFGGSGNINAWLLAASGLVTAVPLLFYANGAKLLKLSTIGMMQYIAPSLVFLIAVFWFREPFTVTTLIAFLFIWAALVVFTASVFLSRRT
ncbi:EamA family transporter RarD [Tianweitania sp. BSSL-BM11]|uniref:EamA family transporter RarD n=1 Tax=Tianweitania aestuarii TaxID=2814886 RepID=A0ABS5RSD0_9HYPH|nr:EamA family transporter RarD [Tianweitania aestuarii]MBS9719963.1 EamA family transporter RarD [Tianweitania aestuarii]